MRWRIVYTDGATFSDEDGAPAAAPGGGVLAIAQQHSEVGALIHHGCDFYVWDRLQLGGWAGMDTFGFADYIIRAEHPVVVKLGRAMDTKLYCTMLDEIRKNGLDKSARFTWEPPMPPKEN